MLYVVFPNVLQIFVSDFSNKFKTVKENKIELYFS